MDAPSISLNHNRREAEKKQEEGAHSEGGNSREEEARLLAKNFEHRLALGPIDLGQSFLHQRAVVRAAAMQHFIQPEGRVAQQDLGVLEPFVLLANTQVHLVGERLDLLKQVTGLVHIARGVLLHAEFGHLVDEFSIKEALFSWLCPGDSGLKGRDAVLIDGLVVWGRSVRRD